MQEFIYNGVPMHKLEPVGKEKNLKKQLEEIEQDRLKHLNKLKSGVDDVLQRHRTGDPDDIILLGCLMDNPGNKKKFLEDMKLEFRDLDFEDIDDDVRWEKFIK